ncbi:glucose/mannose transport system permease protein [Halogranum gelatinilyticum]|uniref:Glucose/mannose transport system permease protein n=1 Tax=Halogranum gelatinilyticum TaxID=660521 RepID=A0A1G9SL23_9EURY|nr:sugar ABC transporter permease [Halogranum gelatinilyticum]SDM36213.1 glucose/mannose transport system permease protein [Halogranum gelatinilyticum]
MFRPFFRACSRIRASVGDGDGGSERVTGSADVRTDDGDAVRTDGGVAESAMAAESDSDSGSVLDSEFVQSLPFWGPPAFLVVLFVYGAVVWNGVISLTDWEGLGQPEYSNFDLSVYVRMAGELADPTSNFFVATRNTVALLVAFTVVTLVLGLLLAILIDQGVRFDNTFRVIYLLPMSLSFVVTAIFWSWMYNPTIGLVNETLRAVGLGAFTQTWLSDPQFKLGAVIFALMWQFSGYAMVVYLAGLQAIPDDQYEAAKVDGASTVRMYWRVIIPQLRSSTTSAAVVLMVFALKAFDFLFVMFGPNPGPSVDILSVMMFREAFMSTNWSYGSGIATVLFAMALGVIAPYLYRQYQRGEL